jgi:holdfast attachment protein HfaA
MAHRSLYALPFALVCGALLATTAAAQSMTANSADYNGGYGRASGQENHAIEFGGARDANGNRTIIDGIIQTGAATVQARASATAAAMADVSGGVGGSGSATAVGNSLTVITQGNNNTVIVNSRQTNSGNISASIGHNVSGGVGQ